MVDVKALEQELKRARQRVNALMESSPLAIIEWSPADRGIVHWSSEATRLFGWAAEEAVGKTIAELRCFHPEDLCEAEQTLTELFSGKRSRGVSTSRNLRKNGSEIHCEWHHAALEDEPGRSSILSHVIDVTERRRAEEALRGKESILRAAFDNAPFEFWARDEDGRCVVQNAAGSKWGELLGLRPEESAVPPEVLATWQENNRRALAGEVVRREVEHLVQGERLHFECVTAPIRVGDEVRGLLGFNIDITQRKLAEEALRDSERRLRQALSVGRIGYLDWNLVTNEIHWSPETYRLYGYDPDGSFSPTIESTVGMVPPEDRDFVAARLEAVVQGKAAYDIDHRMVRPDGQVIHVHAQGEVERDEAGRALRMFGTVIDITGAQARRTDLARGRSSQERVPGHALARAAQPAHPHSQQPLRAGAAPVERGAAASGACDHRQADESPRPPRRRPPRRHAHQPGQDPAAAHAPRPGRGGEQNDRRPPLSPRAARAPRRAAEESRCGSTAIRRGWRRSSETCSTTRPSSRRPRAESPCRWPRTKATRSCRSPTPGSASTPTPSSGSSSPSRRPTAASTAAAAGWAWAWRW